MPKSINPTNFHVQYQEMTTQHWHSESERFAGGDNLMTALEHGWEVDKCVLARHWYAGMRSVKVYEFKLRLGDQTMTMPVIDNPYIGRFIDEEGIELVVPEEARV